MRRGNLLHRSGKWEKLINIENFGYSMLIGLSFIDCSVLEIPMSALWASSE